MSEMSDAAFWFCVAGGGLFVLCLTLALRTARQDRRTTVFVAEQPTEALRGRSEPGEPTCGACGDPATHPAPSIERGRGSWDWLREFLSMPPRYYRSVGGSSALCSSHAHVADALVEEFIHVRVRGAFASAYAAVAIDAAGFEKEALARRLSESLTEDQKRDAKKRAAGGTVTRIRANGGEA